MTRKISSLNIVPLIDILLVIFVVLMVIGRFEDDALPNQDAIIKDMNVSLSQKQQEIEKLDETIKNLSAAKEAKNIDKNSDLLKKLNEELRAENKKVESELKHLKSKNTFEVEIMCEDIDTYIVNGKRLSLNHLIFITNVFNGLHQVEYKWYKNNPSSEQAKETLVRTLNIVPNK